MGLRSHNKSSRAEKRAVGEWERSLGLAPGEQSSESFVGYLEPAENDTGEFADAFGLRERGELVNAVFTDRGRLVLRNPASIHEPIAFDSKRPAVVDVLGPTERRLSGARGGAERTRLVEVSSRGGHCVRLIVPESGVDALVRWGAARQERVERSA
jgi:hypothetical protein